MVVKVGEMLSGLQLPQITDYSAANYQGVMDATMAGYKSAMDAVASKVQVDGQQFARKSRDAQAKAEKEAAMKNQQAAQRGGGGGISGLAELGNALVSGYLGMEEMQRQKKQFELDYKVKSETHEMRKEEFEMGKGAAMEKARIEQLMAGVDAYKTQMTTNFQQAVSTSSFENGIAVAQAELDTFLQSDTFQAMSKQDQSLVSLEMYKHLNDLRGDNLNKVVANNEAIQEASLQTFVNQNTVVNSTALQGLATEYIPDGQVQGTINHVMSSAYSTLPDHIKSNPLLMTKFQGHLLGEIGTALNKRYQQTGQRGAESDRFLKALDDYTILDAARATGDISEYDYQRASQQVFANAGMLNVKPDQLPISIYQQREQEISRQQQTINASRMQQREQAINPAMNTPEMQAVHRYNAGLEAWNAIQGSGRGLEGTVAHYQQLQKTDPELFQLEQGHQVLSVLDDFQADRDSLLSLDKESAKLRQQMAALDYKVNPPKFVERIIDAGTPLGAMMDLLQKPIHTVVSAPERVPQANAEEITALREQMMVIEDQRRDLIYNYAQMGINIEDPHDDTFLKKLDEETRAARQYVDEQSKLNSAPRVQPSYSLPQGNVGGTVAPPKTQTPTSSSRNREYTPEVKRILNIARNAGSGTATGQVTTLPQNEAPGAPAMATSVPLVKAYGGYTPFLSGKVTITSPQGTRKHPIHGTMKTHTGVDLSSPDPRIATIQGGEVVKVWDSSRTGGYGNSVAVRTPDGRVEFFAHLANSTVNVGDKLAPGGQIGIMGSTGTATGPHLHFEVWKAGTDPSTFGKGAQEDVRAYMSMTTRKVQQPSGTGNTPSGQPSTANLPNTGVTKFGQGLYYFRGRVYDPSTGQFRSATSQDLPLIERGVPASTTSTTRIPGARQPERRTQHGSRTQVTWKIPEHVQAQKTFIFVHPAPSDNNASIGTPAKGVPAADGNKYYKRLSQNLTNPHVRAFLDVIAYAEGTYDQPNNGYNTQYSFKQFTGNRHPMEVIHAGGFASSASGRYQVMDFTEKGLREKLGTQDFSGYSQDVRALALIDEKGALNQLVKGNFESTLHAVRKVWASFPGANYAGQGMKPLQELKSFYDQRLAEYKRNPEGGGGGGSLGYDPNSQRLVVRGYKDGKQVFAVMARSGTNGGLGSDRAGTAGAGLMLPDGDYSVATSATPGTHPGVGNTFWATNPRFQTPRASLGIHHDASGEGTAGNLGIAEMADYKRVEDFLRRHPGLMMHVNTRSYEQSLQSAAPTNTPVGRPVNNVASNLSNHRANYGTAQPTSNYGHSPLRDNESATIAMNTAANKMGLPGVWMADIFSNDMKAPIRSSNLDMTREEAQQVASNLGIPKSEDYTVGRLDKKFSPEQQFDIVLPELIKLRNREGKPINTIENLASIVGVDINQVQRNAKKVGRSYELREQRTIANATYHMNPRTNCVVCNNMAHSGNFIPHRHDSNNWNYA